jgi:hypothetical protein
MLVIVVSPTVVVVPCESLTEKRTLTFETALLPVFATEPVKEIETPALGVSGEHPRPPDTTERLVSV